MCESGIHGRIAAKKPLLKDTNKKKRLAWAKNYEQWTLDGWKSVLWSDESNFEILCSNFRVFVRHRVGEQMIPACLVPSVKHGGAGLMVWGYFAGDTISDLFRIQGPPSWLPQHSAMKHQPIWFTLSGTIICFST